MSLIQSYENPMLPKTIYLVGPHSTGKTTLAKGLLKYYDPSTLILGETARKILKEKGYTKEDITSLRCFQMQKDILLAQFDAEMEIKTLHGEFQSYISDRAGIDPIIYTMKYSPGDCDWKELCELKEWELLAKLYRDTVRSLVILVEPCEDFLVDDGTRKIDLDLNEWINFGDMFKEFLKLQNIPFKTIGEDCKGIEDRVQKVVGWVDN